MPFPVRAAAMPATWVPCPRASSAVASSFTKSFWATTLPARSGCPAVMPESTTATLTPFPRVSSQAERKPVFLRPHWSRSPGSPGEYDASRAWSYSTDRTPGSPSSFSFARRSFSGVACVGAASASGTVTTSAFTASIFSSASTFVAPTAPSAAPSAAPSS